MASQSGQFLRRLLEPIVAGGGDRTRPADGAQSPVSPLERNPQSPKGWKKRDSDGVGLGIVAALERSASGEKSPRIVAGATAPIAIGSPRAPGVLRSSFEGSESGCHGNGGWRIGERAGDAVDCGDVRRKETGLYGEPAATKAEESESFRIADFLSCCYLCRKRLDGKDIYMYRGEKAFCSAECRCQQIVIDEYQEKCGLGVRSTPEISSSPYSGAGQLFFTGIVVS